MMETSSKTLCQTTETTPVYVNPDQTFDIKNVRLRHIKVDIQFLIKNMFVFSLFS